MLNRLNALKSRLARVRVGSFRYHLAHGIWGRKVENTRACTFYWFWLPTSVLANIGLGIVWVLWFIVAYAVVKPVAWLLGFSSRRSNSEDLPVEFKFTYGYDPVTKTTHTVAYQHVLLVGGVIAGVILLGAASEALAVALMLAAAGLVFGTIGWVVTRKATKDAWHRICPPLSVVGEDV